MIIPIRCFTCNKVIADVWQEFVQMCNDTPDRVSEILDRLGIARMCCRRHMLSHVELIEYI